MGKLVVLKLNGDFEKGFQVSLEMGEDGQLPDLKMDAYLPRNPELARQVERHWNQTYRSLSNTDRPINAPMLKGEKLEVDCVATPLEYRPSEGENQTYGYRIKRPEVFYGGHLNRRIQECQASARQLELELNQWLQSTSFQSTREEWRDFVRKYEEVRVLVQTQNPLVEKLPWHSWDLLKHGYEKAEIALGSPNFRRQNSRSPIAKEKVKVLAIFGTSEGINIQADRQFLEEFSDRADIKIFVEPERQDINDRLWEQHWDIIFFAGHGETEGNEGIIYLNDRDRLTIGELWYGLRRAVKNGLQLAIFNCCDGLGIARSLDDISIPQTIVMRERVPDLVAQEFLRYFLKAFANGKSLYLSVREARERLQGLENHFPCATWLPVIYQNPAKIPLTWVEYLGLSPVEMREINGTDSSSHRPFRSPLDVPKLAISLLLGMSTLSYPWAIEPIGIQLNKIAVENIKQKRYDRARFYFDLALHLGANKSKVLNNIGYLYERMGEGDLARQHFQKSKLLGDPWGCNNEAFLDILDENYQRADELLRTCLGQMQSTNSELGEYLVRKNLGWALFMKPGSWKHSDYTEAEKHLKVAIELRSEGGTANCVLAQVLDAQNRTSEALQQWQLCFQNVADDRLPESEWKKQAQQHLESLQLSIKNKKE